MNKAKFLGTLLMSGVLLGACTPKEAEKEVESKEVESQMESVVESNEETEVILKDGTYELSEQSFGESGWKESLKIVVTDGIITDATRASVNEEGVNKLEDNDYQAKMVDSAGVGPQDFIPALEAALLEKQNIVDIDVVTGATGTIEKFKGYAQMLLDAAREGNADIIIIENNLVEAEEENDTVEILINEDTTESGLESEAESEE